MQHYFLCAILQDPIWENIPGVEPKRPPCPLNITPMIYRNVTVPAHSTVRWKREDGRDYVLAVYLIQKMTSSNLVEKLKTRAAIHLVFTSGHSKYTEFVSFQVSAIDVAKIIVCPHMEHE